MRLIDRIIEATSKRGLRQTKLGATWVTHGDAELKRNHPLQFTTQPDKWAYGVSATIDCREPIVVKVDAVVETGAVSFGIVASDHSAYLTGESVLTGQRSGMILLEEPARGHLVFRNRSEDGRSSLTVTRIELLRPSDISIADLKRLRAQRHSYWHYDFDVGDGVTIHAELDGGMDAHRLNNKIMTRLLEANFGGVAGKSVLDAACSSGWHSFQLAKAGAKVTAIDVDPSQIDQARFIQTCFNDPRERAIAFRHQDLLTFRPADPFDLIYCSGLMYHLRDPITGADRLRALCKLGAVVHSCIAGWNGEFLELADASKFICCFDGERALVPTAGALRKIFASCGFSKVEMLHPVHDLGVIGEIEALLPGYRNLMVENTAYFVLKP